MMNKEIMNLKAAFESVALRFAEMQIEDYEYFLDGADSPYEEHDYMFELAKELANHSVVLPEGTDAYEVYNEWEKTEDTNKDKFLEDLLRTPWESPDEEPTEVEQPPVEEEAPVAESNGPVVTPASEGEATGESAPIVTPATPSGTPADNPTATATPVDNPTAPKVTTTYNNVQFACNCIIAILRNLAKDDKNQVNGKAITKEIGTLATMANSPFMFDDLLIAARAAYRARWDENAMKYAMEAALRNRGFDWAKPEEDYPPFNVPPKQEASAVRSAEEADRKADALLDNFFRIMTKVGQFTGLKQLMDYMAAQVNANSGNSPQVLLNMARAGYKYIHERIQVMVAVGQVEKARQIAALVGEGQCNIFEATFGGIAALLHRVGDKFAAMFKVNIKSKLVHTILEKFHGFCKAIAKAGKMALKAIAAGASLVTALVVKTATWVIQGIAWVVKGAIATIKHIADCKRKA